LSLPEDLRQEYLQVLGIDSYFPRFRLPGAPESIACEWPAAWRQRLEEDQAKSDDVAVDAPGISVNRPPPPPESKSAPVARSATTPDTGRAGAETEKADVVEVAPRKKAIREEVRLQLLCLRINDRLAVLNVMPHLGPQHLPSGHRNLLTNLLKALNISHEQMQVDEKPFRWPMVQGGHVDNSRSAVAIALNAFLQQKHADWQFNHLLVMGENAIKPVFTHESEDSGSLPSLDDQPWQSLYCRSLDECLHNPQLKKDLWSVFRKLRP